MHVRHAMSHIETGQDVRIGCTQSAGEGSQKHNLLILPYA